MKYSSIIYACSLLLLFYSCDNSDFEGPELTTLLASNLTSYSAQLSTTISNPESELLIKKGICWGLNELPDLSDNFATNTYVLNEYEVTIEDLRADSKYYARSFYTTDNDTVYGNQIEFVTLNYLIFNPDIEYGLLRDIDGNEYKTVSIGDQTWMAENLRTTHYRNGEEIFNDTDPDNWYFFKSINPSYCWYQNDAESKDIYGAFYNWIAVSDERNIAPEGWHVASADEWRTLEEYVKFANYSGTSLCETTTAHWMNRIGTNTTGFTAIANGKRDTDFVNSGHYAYFWTSTGTSDGSTSVLITLDIDLMSHDYHSRGYAVRCVQD